MTVDTTLTIGGDQVDITNPCEVVQALEKAALKLALGEAVSIIQADGERVEFTKLSDARFERLLESYRSRCSAQQTGGRSRFAKRIRFC